ncbi:MAG: hypothetical protein JW786_07555 [Desulfobacterales bacterium]|nr:hypothetical protein [Desulfobacterales bacterium]
MKSSDSREGGKLVLMPHPFDYFIRPMLIGYRKFTTRFVMNHLGRERTRQIITSLEEFWMIYACHCKK